MRAEEYGAGFDAAVRDLADIQDRCRHAVKQTGIAVVDACEKSVVAAVRAQEQTSQAGAEWAADTVRTQTGLTKELNAVALGVLRQLLG
ncbi:hypothetical protein [Streptomyces sp. TP-A0356]|uniref:hypothetical protein n=1 Tax=Streptomyces sp. TP-A0356 TaxID=1359208 RepID=UPI0006E2BFB7|nr:hypothetical protein [Streptomyces sp. TP-A0356]